LTIVICTVIRMTGVARVTDTVPGDIFLPGVALRRCPRRRCRTAQPSQGSPGGDLTDHRRVRPQPRNADWKSDRVNTLRDNDTATAEDAATLRAAMVELMRTHGDLRTDGVTRAFVTVPREGFAPGAPLKQVYDRDDVVITKRDANGLALSSVSAPRIQARMLEQADLRPGMCVLEIGSGVRHEVARCK
jgi:hypothetical protein